MHILQPKHSKMSEKETRELFEKLNISKSQLPKILLSDAALPENCVVGEVIRIERTNTDGRTSVYYRVVV